MANLTSTIKAYRGDKEFQKLITQLGITMELHEIKAYLLGIMLGPQNVPPSYILQEILLHDTEDQIIFKNQEQAEEFYSQFFSLWNHLADYLQNGNYPALFEIPALFANDQAKISFIHSKESELSFFMSGMDESGADEFLDRHLDLLKAVTPLIIIEDILDEAIYDEDENVLANFNEIIHCIADLNDNIWPRSFPVLARVLTGIRVGKIKPQSHKKVKKSYQEYLAKLD